MQIKKLVIENFKSIEKIELDNPNPFTVFVGPNGAGKSTIFEALEFVNTCSKFSVREAIRLFGGQTSILNRNINIHNPFLFEIDCMPQLFGKPSSLSINFDPSLGWQTKSFNLPSESAHERGSTLYTPDPNQQFILQFKHLFVNNAKRLTIDYQDDTALNLKATNLEPVLKRILSNDIIKTEIFEWLDLFIPGFKAVEVDDRNELHWFEESTPEYFTKELISDGTYNILALLTAVYQSEEPQFLCIEEVENGLHPEVILSLMNFFRKQCEEKGHYIWLNTHSETVVRQLTTDEIVLVNKRRGATETKQVKGMNTYSLTTDEAWLTGALGGGLTW